MFSNPLAAMMDSDSESEDDNPLTAMGGPSKRAMQDSDDDSDDGVLLPFVLLFRLWHCFIPVSFVSDNVV